MMNLPDNVSNPASILIAVNIYTELARVHYQRKQLEQADNYYLKVISAALHYDKTHGDKPYSLQVIIPQTLFDTNSLFENIDVRVKLVSILKTSNLFLNCFT